MALGLRFSEYSTMKLRGRLSIKSDPHVVGAELMVCGSMTSMASGFGSLRGFVDDSLGLEIPRFPASGYILAGIGDPERMTWRL